jgi:Flp pilus assembly protein TadD
MWALGKIYQRLDEYSTAMDWFSKANELEPSNPDILREGALCAMKIGKGIIAVQMAASAVELKPGDPGLVSNLALALLIDNRIDEARRMAREAVQAHPEGKIAKAVEQLIEDVHAGRRPRPKTVP